MDLVTTGVPWQNRFGTTAHVGRGSPTRASSRANAEVLADEQGVTAAGFLTRALAWFAARGVAVRRVYSDDGGCYRSHVHRAVVAAPALTHGFTRPCRPRTNGNAERFIRTLLAEWAYAQPCRTSAWRATALPRNLTYYGTARRHSALGFATPADRLAARL